MVHSFLLFDFLECMRTQCSHVFMFSMFILNAKKLKIANFFVQKTKWDMLKDQKLCHFFYSLNKWIDVEIILQIFLYFQLSELEQRVIEAEGRADEAEDKVCNVNFKLIWCQFSFRSRNTLHRRESLPWKKDISPSFSTFYSSWTEVSNRGRFRIHSQFGVPNLTYTKIYPCKYVNAC